MPSIICTQR